MPNLNLVMSLGGILLAALWLFNPGPVEGLKRFFRNRQAVLLAGLYAIHFLWLLNSSDLEYGLKDIRIKLPLLLYPVVISGLGVSRSQLKYTVFSLGIGVTIAMVHGMLWYIRQDGPVADFRDIVRGISHIRFGLMAVLVYASILYFWEAMPKYLKYAAILVGVAIFAFFNLIQAATGSFLLVLVSLFFAGSYIRSKFGNTALLSYAAGLLLLAAIGTLGTRHYYQKYFTPVEGAGRIETHTALGNRYTHMLEARQVENGHYVFLDICNVELIAAWSRRSNVQFDTTGVDRLYPVLLRYLTSKGLPKDEAGVNQLTDADVNNIERGYPGVVYASRKGLALRYHTFLYGYHQYQTSGIASGLSFFQRVVYWNAATKLIQDYFWLGAGTGDVKQSFQEEYSSGRYYLEPQYRNRAHNQFLTFFVSFGILGFLYFIILFAHAFAIGWKNRLYTAFLLIVMVSCLVEDTLETQAGVTFFAFFFMLLSPSVAARKAESL